MDFNLPEPIEVATRAGDRLILVRPTNGTVGYVTIDFEWRRWQLGNHPNRVLNFVPTPFKGRNWKKDLVRDAANALLSMPMPDQAGDEREGSKEEATIPLALEHPEASEAEGTASSEVKAVPSRTTPMPPPGEAPGQSLPEDMNAYAWKRIQDGQLSQGITAATPEALFVQAGFRPYRVLDPIQGFLCVPVRREGDHWVERKGGYHNPG